MKTLILLMTLVVSFTYNLYAVDLLKEEDGFCFYRIRRDEPLPQGFAAPAKVMYVSAYDPALHEGLSTDDMGLDPRFAVYEDFLIQLVEDDFGDYAKPETKRDIFFVTRGESRTDFSNIVGFSALLPREGGHYYLDHFGVSTLYQKHGIVAIHTGRLAHHRVGYTSI